MTAKSLLALLCATYIVRGYCEADFQQDTYLNALDNSHQTGVGHTDKSASEGYEYSNHYLPPATVAPNYHPEKPVYGPPEYGPPEYGPPVYVPAPVYGPPTHHYKPFAYPRDHWLLDKIKSKISILAIGKILLKLLIFKKIVKFIGIICLLLFLPKLKDYFKDDTSAEDDGMNSKIVKSPQDFLEQRVTDIFEFFTDAMKAYEQ